MSGKVGWTEAEKIIEKAGSIPWDDLKFPKGRTKKACMVMVDKEKQKMRKAREANGEGDEGGDGNDQATPKAGGKRKSNDYSGATSQKSKTPRKKKAAAASDDEKGTKEGDEDEQEVKAEPEGDGEDDMPF